MRGDELRVMTPPSAYDAATSPFEWGGNAPSVVLYRAWDNPRTDYHYGRWPRVSGRYSLGIAQSQ
jgi:hypothetical protein